MLVPNTHMYMSAAGTKLNMQLGGTVVKELSCSTVSLEFNPVCRFYETISASC